MVPFPPHNTEGEPFTFLISELTGVSEEAPPVAPPVAPAVSEPQAAAPSLSQSQPCRTEESERPVEQQPPLELPPEPCKVPLHVPISNSMRESLPMNHISTTLTGWIWFLSSTVNNQGLNGIQFQGPDIHFYPSLLFAEVPAPSPAVQLPQQKPVEVPVAMNNPLPFPSSMLAPISRPTTVPHDTDEDEGLKHFEQVSWPGFKIHTSLYIEALKTLERRTLARSYSLRFGCLRYFLSLLPYSERRTARKTRRATVPHSRSVENVL